MNGEKKERIQLTCQLKFSSHSPHVPFDIFELALMQKFVYFIRNKNRII